MNNTYAEHAILVQRYQDGDIGVFDTIYERYHKHIYNTAYCFTCNYEDARDISQEVFIKIYKSLNNLREGSNFHIWLRKITVNTCIDYLRQRKYEQEPYDQENRQIEDVGGGVPDSLVEGAELLCVITEAVDRLSEKQRKAFMLRHYEGLPIKDISKRLNCSEGAVKANISFAAQKLRKMISPYLS